MRLLDLDPSFHRYETKIEDYQVVDGDPATWRERGCPTRTVTGPRHYIDRVESLAEAQAIMFLCPKCFRANSGPVGTHYCHVTFSGRGARDDEGTRGQNGGPVRWSVSGTSFADLSITPSILILAPCGWHGYCTQGEVSIL